jgi:hypothetical protein
MHGSKKLLAILLVGLAAAPLTIGLWGFPSMPGTKYTAPGSSPSASEVDRPRLATPHEPSGHRSPVQPAPDLRFRIRGIDGESRRAVSLEETSKYFSADGILRELNALRYEEHDRVVAMLAAPGYSKRAVLIEGIDGSEEVTINAIRRFEVTMLDGAGSAVVDAGTTLSWWPEPPPDQVTSLAARMLLLFQETTPADERASFLRHELDPGLEDLLASSGPPALPIERPTPYALTGAYGVSVYELPGATSSSLAIRVRVHGHGPLRWECEPSSALESIEESTRASVFAPAGGTTKVTIRLIDTGTLHATLVGRSDDRELFGVQAERLSDSLEWIPIGSEPRESRSDADLQRPSIPFGQFCYTGVQPGLYRLAAVVACGAPSELRYRFVQGEATVEAGVESQLLLAAPEFGTDREVDLLARWPDGRRSPLSDVLIDVLPLRVDLRGPTRSPLLFASRASPESGSTLFIEGVSPRSELQISMRERDLRASLPSSIGIVGEVTSIPVGATPTSSLVIDVESFERVTLEVEESRAPWHSAFACASSPSDAARVVAHSLDADQQRLDFDWPSHIVLDPDECRFGTLEDDRVKWLGVTRVPSSGETRVLRASNVWITSRTEFELPEGVDRVDALRCRAVPTHAAERTVLEHLGQPAGHPPTGYEEDRLWFDDLYPGSEYTLLLSPSGIDGIDIAYEFEASTESIPRVHDLRVR